MTETVQLVMTMVITAWATFTNSMPLNEGSPPLSQKQPEPESKTTQGFEASFETEKWVDRLSKNRALAKPQKQMFLVRGACLRLDRKRASKKIANRRDGPALNWVTFPA